ncbi:flagellar filament capping protein FliD [Romboutsia sp.]|uniref:flagellar filament capping protein FliD n=1 Tax=Romboutsia sp. TaxID=1965302 RepID=UPI002B7A30B4|nr:flagellar filament capping protein FliD [Romboutsia sp.]HSQ88378.1 flagellar filament capping protein FliD [Romboutsia sp.]
MASVNSVRIPGLATGMDTDSVIKDMLTGQQNKIDKAKQKEQTIKWQQETYRDIIKDVKGLADKYFTATSQDYILGSKTFSTTKVNSSNSSVVSATAGAGAGNIDYKFDVVDLAKPPKISITEKDGVALTKDTNIGLAVGTTKTFKIDLGNGQFSKDITIDENDTIDTLITKINASNDSQVKASFSDMTGTFTIQGSKTGESSTFKIEPPDALSSLSIDGTEIKGSNSLVNITGGGIIGVKEVKQETNSFTIDNVKYDIKGIGQANLTSEISADDTVDKIKAFIDDYNKVMDKIYGEIIEKKNRDFPPLTDAQKEEMSEEEIEKWEEKAKQGMLRNDNELRMFMEDTKQALFGPIEDMGINLTDIGITSSQDYNKQGQIYLDEEKFKKALLENGEQVYQALTKTATDKSQSGSLERMKDVFNKYVGNSKSIFAKKAGIEKTASAANNLFGEQIKSQQENIKNLQRKMDEKEKQLYKKFAALEASMNKFNSQMNYLMSQ